MNIYNNEQIREYIDAKLDTDGMFVGSDVRKQFKIGGSRLARICATYVDSNIVESTSKGYVLVEEFDNEVELEDNSELDSEDNDMTDEEIIAENVRLSKRLQSYMDKNRIERKSFRDFVRIENAVSAYSEAITEQNKQFAEELSKIKVPDIIPSKSGVVGVLQISDWHANEIINLPNNKYDFYILSARAKKLADESITLFKSQNITSVLIAATGDLINSDLRVDKILNQATNRSKASVMLGYILTQFIMHLRQHFSISIISTMGNESRMQEKWHSSDNVVSDNYDHTVFANLKQKFEFANISDITFGDIDKMETVVDVNGQNWLITHDVSKATSSQGATQSKIGSYSLKGVPIKFVIGGHIHFANATNISSRSGSLSGSNSYNENALNLTGIASQSIFMVGRDFRHAIVIDLQNVDVDNRYDLIPELSGSDLRNFDKDTDKQQIFKVE